MPEDYLTTETEAQKELVAVCCAIATGKTKPPTHLSAWGKQLFWLKLKVYKKKGVPKKKRVPKKLLKYNA